MNKYRLPAAISGTLFFNSVLADPGLSSLEGLWIFFLVIGLIVTALVILGVFWLRITYFYFTKRKERFYRLKTYIFLAVTISLVSGLSAFTFHANAPYSQNIYFLITAVLVFVTSVLAVGVQYKS